MADQMTHITVADQLTCITVADQLTLVTMHCSSDWRHGFQKSGKALLAKVQKMVWVR